MPIFRLQPMRGERFQVVGLPEGFAIVAHRTAAGEVDAFDFFTGAQESQRFERRAVD